MTQVAAMTLDAISAPGGKPSPRDLASASGLDAQRAINQNGVFKVGGDQIADSVRAHVASLLTLERKVKPQRSDAEGGLAITVLGGDTDPAGTKVLGQNPTASGGDAALGNLKDAFEYATNAALVSLALTSVTNGITTLTTRGG